MANRDPQSSLFCGDSSWSGEPFPRGGDQPVLSFRKGDWRERQRAPDDRRATRFANRSVVPAARRQGDGKQRQRVV